MERHRIDIEISAIDRMNEVKEKILFKESEPLTFEQWAKWGSFTKDIREEIELKVYNIVNDFHKNINDGSVDKDHWTSHIRDLNPMPHRYAYQTTYNFHKIEDIQETSIGMKRYRRGEKMYELEINIKFV